MSHEYRKQNQLNYLTSVHAPAAPTKHATYQIVLPIIYLHCFKGKGRCGWVGVGMDIKKASNHMNKMLVAQSDRYHFSLMH